MTSNMVGGALKTAFSLLLLASIVQGLRDVDLFHNETVEAVVGQNVSLPCIVRNITNLKVVNTEWSKRENEIIKLALYTPGFGLRQFRPNVSIQTVYNDAKNFMGSYLQLYEVERENSGIYVCDITTFPFGSVRVETELKIKDAVRIMCDANNTVEVQSGENVTIHCEVSQKAHCTWTKNKKLVSQSESLELWWVTSAHAGLYTLTVNTGSETVHKKFYITVLATTTSPKRDLADSSVTSQTSELPPTDSSVTWTTAVGSDVTRYDLRSEESSTLRSSTANSSTPGATTTLSLSAGNTTEATQYNGSSQTYWWLVFIIVLLLIIVAVCLYTRRIRRER
ncbi:nectin-3-like protein [Scomber japonicus]|uniref:nectin-3-like protein n=1 Tax=Scomber japonicus TaxID=13676 RepID=UPI002305C99A|nr:nectin-3-like protein [Scomber japonicus]